MSVEILNGFLKETGALFPKDKIQKGERKVRAKVQQIVNHDPYAAKVAVIVWAFANVVMAVVRVLYYGQSPDGVTVGAAVVTFLPLALGYIIITQLEKNPQ